MTSRLHPQSAAGPIDWAEATARLDIIRVIRSQTCTAQQNNINTAQGLEIVVGQATCAQTLLSGAGGHARSVLTIINRAGKVKLRKLSITDVDQSAHTAAASIPAALHLGPVDIPRTSEA